MDLIVQLKQQHIEILHFFESLKSDLVQEDVRDNFLIKDLRELQDFLIGHLTLEDTLLYPALEKSKSDEAMKIGKKFSTEMLGISKVAVKFFEEYLAISLSDLLKSAKFKKDAGLIITAVKKRIDLEEKVLYPTYNKYCKKR